MPNKIYAVRVGRQKGLFNSWAECQKQVAGYPGAKFKSFTNPQEAMQFLTGAVEQAPLFSPPSSVRRGTIPTETDAEPTDADYIIYTDGSCLRNPAGPGGWAAVIKNVKTGALAEHSAGNPSTTNNRMELSAAIGALEAVPAQSNIHLYTDSQYLKNAFTKHWIRHWKKNGWKTAKGTDVLNQDLWRKLDALFSARAVTFHWVKGHVGVAENERCDALAKAEAMKFNGV